MLGHLARIRRDGFETGWSGARLPGAQALAVPVVEDDDVVAAVSLTNHRSALSAQDLLAHRRLLLEATQRWSRRAHRDA